MGHLIPAGTGSAFYKGMKIKVDEPEDELPIAITAAPTVEIDDIDFKAEDGDLDKKVLDQA